MKPLSLFALLVITFAFKSFAQDMLPVLQEGHPKQRFGDEKRLIASQDQRFVLSYSDRGDYRLWDVFTGRLLQRFYSPTRFRLMSFWAGAGSAYVEGPSLSPDSRYLLTEDGASLGYLLWDTKTGRQLKRYNKNTKGDSVFYTVMRLLPNNHILAVGLNRAKQCYEAGILDLDGHPLKTFYFRRQFLKFEKEEDGHHGPIAVNADQSLLAIGTMKGKIFLFNIKNADGNHPQFLEPKSVYPLSDYPVSKVVFAEDGKQLITATHGEVKVWDTRKEKLVRSFTYGNSTWKRWDGTMTTIFGGISNNGKVIIYEDTTKKAKFVYENATGKLLLQHQFENKRYVEGPRIMNGINDISDDGRYLYQFSSYCQEIHVLDLVKKETKHRIRMSETFAVTCARYDPTRDELYLGKLFNDASIFSFKSGRISHLRNFVYDGDTVQDNRHNNQIDYYSNLLQTSLWFSPDYKYILTADAGLPLSHRKYAYVWNTSTKENLAEIQNIQNEDGYPQLGKKTASTARWQNLFEPILLNKGPERISEDQPDNKQRYGWRVTLANGQKKIIYSIDPAPQKEADATFPAGAYYSKDRKFLYAGITYGHIQIYRMSDGQLVRSIRFDAGGSPSIDLDGFIVSSDERYFYGRLSSGGGRIVKVDAQTGTPVTTYTSEGSDVVEIKLIPEHHLLVAVCDDKHTRIFDERTGKLLVTIVFSGKEYLLFTPEGYYYASRNGLAMLHYVSGYQVFLPQQFDLKFNRPDKVFEALGTLEPAALESYREAYQQRLIRSGLKYTNTQLGGVVSAPVVTIENRSGETVNSDQLDLRFTCSDNSRNIRLYKIWINGVPLPAPQAIAVNQRESRQIVSITLSQGRNIIEVAALNESGVESLHAFTEIYSKRAPRKPRLYLVAIGVDQYRSLGRLKYAVKDARDLVSVYGKQTQYSEVIVDTLFNQHFQQARLAIVRQHLQQAAPDDQVLIFYSGHGISDGRQLYLAPAATSIIAYQETGIPLDSLSALLTQTPARNKLMLLDACQSGEAAPFRVSGSNAGLNGPVKFANTPGGRGVRKNIPAPSSTAFDLMKDIFADLTDNNSGATVIAAARTYGEAKERDDLKNGVFTACYLKGLKNLTADLDADKTITTYEIGQYLFKQVPLMQKGQIPEIRAENPLNHFVIWR